MREDGLVCRRARHGWGLEEAGGGRPEGRDGAGSSDRSRTPGSRPAPQVTPASKDDQFSIDVLLPPLYLNQSLYTAPFKVLVWGPHSKSRFLSDKVPIDMTETYGAENAVPHLPAEGRAVRRKT
jgi:hypothetical protein